MVKITTVTCKACDGAGIIGVISPESLRETRTQAGVGLRKFAKRLKLSAPYISDIENGRRGCTEKIAEAYRSLYKQTQPKGK